MKEQFTPGDWLNDGTTVYALQDSTRHGKPIKINRFQFNIQGKCSDEELLANAVLAKVAPKMYRMLEKLSNSGQWFMSAVEFELHEDGRALANEILSILAEARGEKT